MRKRYLLLLLTLIFGLALIAVDRYTQELNQPLSEQQSNEADYYGETLLNWHYGEGFVYCVAHQILVIFYLHLQY